MRTILASMFVIAAMTSLSCDPPLQQITAKEAIANFTQDPLDCMVYRGIDETFYYLDRVKFKTHHRFKVLRAELDIPESVKIGDLPIGMKARPATQPAS